ncbi:M23 family metallopeptidase [bacterium]|nr:M23 family metallopeptidase [bacterium]MBU1433834.1 M23 family metallopeptidase [bacterium]MBU1503909.1 M23 family metallopeptidase [bacterium]
MIRIFFFLFFLVSSIDAQKYPIFYERLATPLYTSTASLKKLSEIEDLNKSCTAFIANAEQALQFAKEINASDASVAKEYLLKLRKLQKEYDHTLHLIHEQINKSINENDYEKFLQLTNCDLTGLLENRALLDASLEFYEKNKKKKKSSFLDEKAETLRLIEEYQNEFVNESVTDIFDSSKKGKKGQKVYLEAKKSASEIVISAHNNNPYSVTLSVNAEYSNLKSDKGKYSTLVLGAHSNAECIRFSTNDANPYSYTLKYSWILGSQNANHDESYVYRLPFATGSAYRVSQGFNGKTTHFGHSQYAIDFAMDIGTKIYAARDGKVAKTKSDSNTRGIGREYSKYGNFVTIEHNDGTFATYYHLKQHGAAVKVGDVVQRGDFLGYSGNTGYSSGPHLHFAVFTLDSRTKTQTLPVKFISSAGLVEDPRIGSFYQAK